MIALSSRVVQHLVLAITLVRGLPLNNDNAIIHERISHLPAGWDRHSTLPENLKITFQVALRQANLHKLDSYLDSVSNPESIGYGKHWTADEITKAFAPADDTISGVGSWLQKSGISTDSMKLSASKGWLDFRATIQEVQDLLKTQFFMYEHQEKNISYVGCEEYSIPASLRGHIDFITPTVHFDLHHDKSESPRQQFLAAIKKRAVDLKRRRNVHPQRRSLRNNIIQLTDVPASRTALTNPCDQLIQPKCLQQLYTFTDLSKSKINRNLSLAVVEYNANSWLGNDLDTFYGDVAPQVPLNTRPRIYSIDGGRVQKSNPGVKNDNFGEASADLQYTIPFVHPLRVGDFQVGSPLDYPVSNTSFNNFLDALDASYCTENGGNDPNFDDVYPNQFYPHPRQCGVYQPPQVISVSYGYPEGSLGTTPAGDSAYAMRQCNEYAKLGLAGSTILYASGDEGTGFIDTNQCYNGSSTDLVPGGNRFVPGFPSTCPYVTSVGGTQVQPGKTVKDPEQAVYFKFPDDSEYTSGGGFSNQFLAPAYQKAAIAYYYKYHNPRLNSSTYNNSRIVRGYPDVSTSSLKFYAVIGGRSTLVSGTSLSTPVFASLITMINNARLNAGKGPVGFINPTLYANPYVLNDVSLGYNKGCGRNVSFTAVKGWDPVTGLGTPNYPKMLRLWMSLP